jgi:hypothetical protein
MPRHWLAGDSLNWLCQHYDRLDFTSLREGVPANLATPDPITPLQGLVMTCFFHYFDMPTVVCYIGGQHTVASRDVPAILQELRWAYVESAVLAGLERIFTIGSPALCNASVT